MWRLKVAVFIVLVNCGLIFNSTIAWIPPLLFNRRQSEHRTSITPFLLLSKDAQTGKENDVEDENGDWFDGNAELVADDDENENDDEWVPDRELARRRKATQYQTASAPQPPPSQQQAQQQETNSQPQTQGTMYTEEEEALIDAMGGKFKDAPKSKREDGFLGDSTLQEIATDYSVPVCYLADVLCMWGVPVPINIHDRLGDLVTGEQAFAIVEAIYSLDISALHDRYSNQSLLSFCDDYDIDLKDAFEMAVKEGWSLPFGVQTCLRVEQEEELIRVFGAIA